MADPPGGRAGGVHAPRPRSLLLVEDDEADAALARAMLHRDEWTVTHVTTVAAAQAVLATPGRSVAVVLLDLGLPDVQGVETVAMMVDHDVPLVVLSGASEVDMGEPTIAAGAQDFLEKGRLDALSLARSIRHAIDRHTLRRDLERANLRARDHAMAVTAEMVEPLRRIEGLARLVDTELMVRHDDAQGSTTQMRERVHAILDVAVELIDTAADGLTSAIGGDSATLDLHRVARAAARSVTPRIHGTIRVLSLPMLRGNRVDVTEIFVRVFRDVLALPHDDDQAITVAMHRDAHDDLDVWISWTGPAGGPEVVLSSDTLQHVKDVMGAHDGRAVTDQEDRLVLLPIGPGGPEDDLVTTPGLTKVLLLEDDLADADSAIELLTDGSEFVVDHVPLLSGAMELLAQQRYDCAVVDLNVPDAQGLTAIEQMVTADVTMAIVVLSGEDDDEVTMGALAAGAEDYLIKGHIDAALIRRATRFAIARRRARSSLVRRALTDPLTGLASRLSVEQQLPAAVSRAERGGVTIAALFVDLDGLDQLYRQMGPAVADGVLVEAAQRLSLLTRESDLLARIGDSSFLILCEDVQVDASLRHLGERVEAAFARRFTHMGAPLEVGASLTFSSQRGAAPPADLYRRGLLPQPPTTMGL